MPVFRCGAPNKRKPFQMIKLAEKVSISQHKAKMYYLKCVTFKFLTEMIELSVERQVETSIFLNTAVAQMLKSSKPSSEFDFVGFLSKPYGK